jgi:hypothetical protein
MLRTELEILDSLLGPLKGPSRLLWKLRTSSRIYYRAALAARDRRERYLHFLLRSLAYWPSPAFEPRRFKALGIYLAGRR